jgi:tetratricopeptide (TPR) repeat protein
LAPRSRAAVQSDQQIQRWKDLAWNIACLDSIGLTRVDCFKRMAALYHQTNNRQQEIEQEKQIADTHMKQGFFELAERELLDVVLKFKAIGFSDLHYTYQLLYESNHQKGDYNKALYYALLAVESMQKPAVPVSASYTIMFYSALARLYEELGRTGKSIDNYRLIFSSPPPSPYDFYMYREAGDFVRELVKGNKQREAQAFLDTFSVNHPPRDRYAQASLVRTFAWFYGAIGQDGLAESYSRRLIVLGRYLGKDNEIRGDVEFDHRAILSEQEAVCECRHAL